jgi:signal transduction histidine kinase
MIVADDGPGIAPAAREHLFQPFAGSTRRGGTGLGLPIAREVLRAHGGDVVLQESGAGGTRFRMELPDQQGDDSAGGTGSGSQALSRRAIS